MANPTQERLMASTPPEPLARDRQPGPDPGSRADSGSGAPANPSQAGEPSQGASGGHGAPEGNAEESEAVRLLMPELQMTWQGSQKVGPGLKNLGNTCYLNSVLQCLTYTPPLANFCLQQRHSSACSRLNGTEAASACPFCLLEKRIIRSLTLGAARDIPRSIVSRIKLIAKSFSAGRQEDAHELLRFAVEACNKVCVQMYKRVMPKQKGAKVAPVTSNEVLEPAPQPRGQDTEAAEQNPMQGHEPEQKVSSPETEAKEAPAEGSQGPLKAGPLKVVFRRKGVKAGATGPRSSSGKPGAKSEGRGEPEPHTIVKEIFGGLLQSQVKCLRCSGESNKRDVMMDLCLDVFRISSIREALQRYTKPEILDGDNKYRCERCKKLSVARKALTIHHAPNVLVIQFKRFENVFGGKIDRHIKFEERLSLADHMSEGTRDPSPEYQLYGVVVHAGYSQDSGHYYAYVKDSFGNWSCCDDSSVTPASVNEVLRDKAYMLFYVRTNLRPPLAPEQESEECSTAPPSNCISSRSSSITGSTATSASASSSSCPSELAFELAQAGGAAHVAGVTAGGTSAGLAGHAGSDLQSRREPSSSSGGRSAEDPVLGARRRRRAVSDSGDEDYKEEMGAPSRRRRAMSRDSGDEDYKEERRAPPRRRVLASKEDMLADLLSSESEEEAEAESSDGDEEFVEEDEDWDEGSSDTGRPRRGPSRRSKRLQKGSHSPPCAGRARAPAHAPEVKGSGDALPPAGAMVRPRVKLTFRKNPIRTLGVPPLHASSAGRAPSPTCSRAQSLTPPPPDESKAATGEEPQLGVPEAHLVPEGAQPLPPDAQGVSRSACVEEASAEASHAQSAADDSGPAAEEVSSPIHGPAPAPSWKLRRKSPSGLDLERPRKRANDGLEGPRRLQAKSDGDSAVGAKKRGLDILGVRAQSLEQKAAAGAEASAPAEGPAPKQSPVAVKTSAPGAEAGGTPFEGPAVPAIAEAPCSLSVVPKEEGPATVPNEGTAARTRAVPLLSAARAAAHSRKSAAPSLPGPAHAPASARKSTAPPLPGPARVPASAGASAVAPAAAIPVQQDAVSEPPRAVLSRKLVVEGAACAPALHPRAAATAEARLAAHGGAHARPVLLQGEVPRGAQGTERTARTATQVPGAQGHHGPRSQTRPETEVAPLGVGPTEAGGEPPRAPQEPDPRQAASQGALGPSTSVLPSSATFHAQGPRSRGAAEVASPPAQHMRPPLPANPDPFSNVGPRIADPLPGISDAQIPQQHPRNGAVPLRHLSQENSTAGPRRLVASAPGMQGHPSAPLPQQAPLFLHLRGHTTGSPLSPKATPGRASRRRIALNLNTPLPVGAENPSGAASIERGFVNGGALSQGHSPNGGSVFRRAGGHNGIGPRAPDGGHQPQYVQQLQPPFADYTPHMIGPREHGEFPLPPLPNDMAPVGTSPPMLGPSHAVGHPMAPSPEHPMGLPGRSLLRLPSRRSPGPSPAAEPAAETPPLAGIYHLHQQQQQQQQQQQYHKQQRQQHQEQQQHQHQQQQQLRPEENVHYRELLAHQQQRAPVQHPGPQHWQQQQQQRSLPPMGLPPPQPPDYRWQHQQQQEQQQQHPPAPPPPPLLLIRQHSSHLMHPPQPQEPMLLPGQMLGPGQMHPHAQQHPFQAHAQGGMSRAAQQMGHGPQPARVRQVQWTNSIGESRFSPLSGSALSPSRPSLPPLHFIPLGAPQAGMQGVGGPGPSPEGRWQHYPGQQEPIPAVPLPGAAPPGPLERGMESAVPSWARGLGPGAADIAQPAQRIAGLAAQVRHLVPVMHAPPPDTWRAANAPMVGTMTARPEHYAAELPRAAIGPGPHGDALEGRSWRGQGQHEGEPMGLQHGEGQQMEEGVQRWFRVLPSAASPPQHSCGVPTVHHFFMCQVPDTLAPEAQAALQEAFSSGGGARSGAIKTGSPPAQPADWPQGRESILGVGMKEHPDQQISPPPQLLQILHQSCKGGQQQDAFSAEGECKGSGWTQPANGMRLPSTPPLSEPSPPRAGHVTGTSRIRPIRPSCGSARTTPYVPSSPPALALSSSWAAIALVEGPAQWQRPAEEVMHWGTPVVHQRAQPVESDSEASASMAAMREPAAAGSLIAVHEASAIPALPAANTTGWSDGGEETPRSAAASEAGDSGALSIKEEGHAPNLH